MGKPKVVVYSFALLLAVAAAGCGSSNKSSSSTGSTGTGSSTTAAEAASTGAASGGKTYTLAKTQKCLDGKGFQASVFHNKVVSGSGGELKVVFGYGTDWIYIAFGKDAAEAKAIQARAVAVTLKHVNIQKKDVIAGVRQRGNVFYYADGGPVTGIEQLRIQSCLR